MVIECHCAAVNVSTYCWERVAVARIRATYQVFISAVGCRVHLMPYNMCKLSQIQLFTQNYMCVSCMCRKASGDRSRLIHIWNAETCQLLHSSLTRQHRDAISVSNV